MEECPKCGNRKIKEVGGMEIHYEISVSTGKYLKKGKNGKAIWWKNTCGKCGWESEELTE